MQCELRHRYVYAFVYSVLLLGSGVKESDEMNSSFNIEYIFYNIGIYTQSAMTFIVMLMVTKHSHMYVGNINTIFRGSAGLGFGF
jgi:hypothetical protein